MKPGIDRERGLYYVKRNSGQLYLKMLKRVNIHQRRQGTFTHITSQMVGRQKVRNVDFHDLGVHHRVKVEFLLT